MRLAEHLVTTPAAVVGTATRSDERHGSLAVVFPPSLDVSRKIDRLPIRPRLCIKIANLLPGLRPYDRSIGFAEHNSVYVVESVRTTQAKRWDQLLHRQFSFADHHHVGPRFQVFRNVCARFRPTNHGLPPGLPRHS